MPPSIHVGISHLYILRHGHLKWNQPPIYIQFPLQQIISVGSVTWFADNRSSRPLTQLIHQENVDPSKKKKKKRKKENKEEEKKQRAS